MKSSIFPLAVLIIVVSIIRSGIANSDGAPASACADMLPVHGENVAPKTGRSPFVTAPLENEVSSDGCVAVVLKPSDSSSTFKGFMTMAFAENHPEKAIGVFKPLDEQSKTLDCNKRHSKNALTQKNAETKTSVNFEWCPPHNFNGTVTFKTTWLTSFNEFWVKESSTPVQVKRAAKSGKANNKKGNKPEKAGKKGNQNRGNKDGKQKKQKKPHSSEEHSE